MRRIATAVPLLAALLLAPALLSQPVELAVRDDPRIADMVSAVSRDRLATNIQELQNVQTRFTTTSASVAAANRLYDYFRRLDLQTSYQDFTFDGTWNKQPVPGVRASNIVVTIPGTVTPAQIVLVGAHYDSTSGADSPILAPGADDDAGGTAAVMEIARVLAGRSFRLHHPLRRVRGRGVGPQGQRVYGRDRTTAQRAHRRDAEPRHGGLRRRDAGGSEPRRERAVAVAECKVRWG